VYNADLSSDDAGIEDIQHDATHQLHHLRWKPQMIVVPCSDDDDDNDDDDDDDDNDDDDGDDDDDVCVCVRARTALLDAQLIQKAARAL
jgi:hypothetical protein